MSTRNVTTWYSQNALDYQGDRILDLGAGWNHACVLDARGEVYCWRIEAERFRITHSDCGPGLSNCRESYPGDLLGQPERIELPGPALALAVTDDAACALLEVDRVACWAAGEQGPLGSGGSDAILTFGLE